MPRSSVDGQRIVAHEREREPRLGELLLGVVQRTVRAHVGMADERVVGFGDVIARFVGQRLGRVVLAAMRRADRRRARLDRLARRRDRDLARAVLLVERVACARAEGGDLRGAIHALRRGGAPQRELGRRLRTRQVVHLLGLLGLHRAATHAHSAEVRDEHHVDENIARPRARARPVKYASTNVIVDGDDEDTQHVAPPLGGTLRGRDRRARTSAPAGVAARRAGRAAAGLRRRGSRSSGRARRAGS